MHLSRRRIGNHRPVLSIYLLAQSDPHDFHLRQIFKFSLNNNAYKPWARDSNCWPVVTAI